MVCGRSGGFAAAVVYAIVAAIVSPGSIDVRDDAPLLILGVAGLILLLGWWRDRARRSAAGENEWRERERLENELSEARDELGSASENEDTLRRERERLESRLGEAEKELGRERYLRMRSERAHQAERNWHRELHSEVMRLSRERGALGDLGTRTTCPRWCCASSGRSSAPKASSTMIRTVPAVLCP